MGDRNWREELNQCGTASLCSNSGCKRVHELALEMAAEIERLRGELEKSEAALAYYRKEVQLLAWGGR